MKAYKFLVIALIFIVLLIAAIFFLAIYYSVDEILKFLILTIIAYMIAYFIVLIWVILKIDK